MDTTHITTILVGGLVGLMIGAVFLVIFGFIFRLLWNSTLPEVLNVKPVTTWQAIKILFIAAILFGGHRAVDSKYAQPDQPAKIAAGQTQAGH